MCFESYSALFGEKEIDVRRFCLYAKALLRSAGEPLARMSRRHCRSELFGICFSEKGR
jgi:hypothetical protein